RAPTDPLLPCTTLFRSCAAYEWAVDYVIPAAVVAFLALLGVASTGEARGRRASYAIVAMGAVVLPTSAQVTNVELAGLGGPGLRSEEHTSELQSRENLV